MSELHFIDIETFGLDAGRHAIFEIAICGLRKNTPTHCFFLEPEESELAVASDMALQMTDYYARLEKHSKQLFKRDPSAYQEPVVVDIRKERPPGELVFVPTEQRHQLAIFLARTLNDHIAGNSVSFDALRLAAWLRKHGAAPQWHYHIVDVEAYAAGAIGFIPPWSSGGISKKLEVEVPDKDRHTALADVAWSRAMYIEAVKRSERRLGNMLPDGVE